MTSLKNLDPYDKRVNAYGIRFDTPTLKNAAKWVGLRNYRVSRRKTWRNLSIDDPFVGRKYNGRLDDFSNPLKDITIPVFNYTRQMRNASKLDVKNNFKDAGSREAYFNKVDATIDNWTAGWDQMDSMA